MKRSAEKKNLKMTHLNKLTLGEKIVKAVVTLLKVAAIVALVLTIGYVVLSFVIGTFIAFAVAHAIADGFGDAARAYRTGDRYVRWF